MIMNRAGGGADDFVSAQALAPRDSWRSDEDDPLDEGRDEDLPLYLRATGEEEDAQGRECAKTLHVADPVFCHHLYEYERGVRGLILHTTARENLDGIRYRLQRRAVSYEIYPLKNDRINVFFGSAVCVGVIRAIGKTLLQEYTPEEDFILGTMLGYSRRQQCERYLTIKSRSNVRLPDLAG